MALSDKKVRSQLLGCTQVTSEILWQALVDNKPADRLLGGVFRANRKFGSRDRRLISETVYALFRWWGWLHHLAPRGFVNSMLAKRAGKDVQMPNLPILIWGRVLLAANILDAGKIPAVFHGLLAGYNLRLSQLEEIAAIDDLQMRMNGLLELLTEAGRQVVVVDKKELVPEWFFEELEDGKNLGRLLDWLQKRPPVWLRLQTDNHEGVVSEFASHGVKLEQHPLMKNAYCIVNTPVRVNLRTLQCFRNGSFEIQDLASQVIGVVSSPKAGERWWDACAGAGGKSLQLADIMKRRGSVTATDIRTYKLDDLKKRARRSGFPNIRCREWKGKKLPKKWCNFQGGLVDSPCSCSGTWRRNPDARWSAKHEDIAEITELQYRLLDNASAGVVSGGVLLYATCSLYQRENSGVVKQFLANHPEFSLEEFVDPITGEMCSGMLQTWPWEGNCDAMFVARMRRK